MNFYQKICRSEDKIRQASSPLMEFLAAILFKKFFQTPTALAF